MYTVYVCETAIRAGAQDSTVAKQTKQVKKYKAKCFAQKGRLNTLPPQPPPPPPALTIAVPLFVSSCVMHDVFLYFWTLFVPGYSSYLPMWQFKSTQLTGRPENPELIRNWCKKVCTV